MINLANYEMNNFTEESAATVLQSLTPTPSKKALNLDLNLNIKSTGRKQPPAVSAAHPPRICLSAADLCSVWVCCRAPPVAKLTCSTPPPLYHPCQAALEGPSNSGTPWREPGDKPAWDTTGYLATPKSPANTMLQSPPSSLRPPPGLDLPAAKVTPMRPLDK